MLSKMKKKFVLLCLCCILVSGCTQAENMHSIVTEIAEVTTAVLAVDGLEITAEDGWVYVNIPADYTDENIGEYFRETENVIYAPVDDSMFCVENGALYSKDMTKLYAVPSWCEDEETKELPNPQKAFTVPESVTWIAPNAFHMITSERPLINLYIHDGITEENRKELVLWGGTFVIRK